MFGWVIIEVKRYDIFHSSASVIEFSVIKIEFQPKVFLARPFFHHFYPKIAANAHFNSVFSNIEWFNIRKTANTVRFSIINLRMSIIYTFTIKTNFRNMSKNRRFRRKKKEREQSRLKMLILPPFFQKTAAFLEKRKTLAVFTL